MNAQLGTFKSPEVQNEPMVSVQFSYVRKHLRMAFICRNPMRQAHLSVQRSKQPFAKWSNRCRSKCPLSSTVKRYVVHQVSCLRLN